MEETSGTDGAGHQEAPALALPPRSFGEVSGFNGLRGIAVLIVFVAHMDVILPIPTLLVIPGATVSLDSFFVLSGFLITALLLREQARYGGIGIGPFYRRRALRLLPALYVVVLANALFAYFSRQWLHTEWPSIFSVLFYYSNYYSAAAAGPLSPNLAVRLPAPVVTVVRGAVLSGLAFADDCVAHDSYAIAHGRHYLVLIDHDHRRPPVYLLQDSHRWWSSSTSTDTRADSILWGALLAHVWIRRKEPRRGHSPWRAGSPPPSS